jgi:hypothetical protein
MLGLGSKWNGELVDLSENDDASRKYLIPQIFKIHLFQVNILPHQLPSLLSNGPHI